MDQKFEFPEGQPLTASDKMGVAAVGCFIGAIVLVLLAACMDQSVYRTAVGIGAFVLAIGWTVLGYLAARLRMHEK